MKLVEVTRAIQTSDETFQTAFDLMASLGKTPVCRATKARALS